MGDASNNISWLLLRVSLRAKKGLMKLAEDYNMTAMQAFAVCLLEPEKVVSMHSISEMLVCDASSVTGIVDKLVAQAYIERKESDIDRRVNTITLTKKGANFHNKFLKEITTESFYLPNITKLTEDEQETFKNLLVKILAVSR
jgi:DNA-binding MarR family transcriptional regulator